MLRNNEDWKKFEKQRLQNEKNNLERNLKIFNEMYLEASLFFKNYPADHTHTIQHKIKMAKALNAIPRSS